MKAIMKRTIIVPDATRPLNYRAALEDLARPGSTVIIGLGLHRPMTAGELAPLASACRDFGHTVVQHDPDRVVDTEQGAFAPEVVDADELICVGVVEPHQYAGFSGGIKGAVIGCGSRDVIAEMHSLTMLNKCKARVGWFERNPFQSRLWELARGICPRRFARFIVPGRADFIDGELNNAFGQAVALSKEMHFRPVEPVDTMLLRVPPPKDVNFYQASRAATYVALAERRAIREGGTIYLDAGCPEGIGEGAGERTCAEAMMRGKERLFAELRSQTPPTTRGGEQRAYVLAMALEHANIVLVGAQQMPELAALGIRQVDAAPEVDLIVDDPIHAVPIASAAPQR